MGGEKTVAEVDPVAGAVMEISASATSLCPALTKDFGGGDSGIRA